jgi:hypothetical protein
MVMSSLPVADPSWEGQMQQAWTQPAGWTAKEADKEQGRTGK